MFVDANALADGTAVEADICIAGAGAAGITIALDLRGLGLSVILLESGGLRREAETQILSDGRMTGINTWSMRAMRIRALGGTTGHWEGWCRPLMPQDFEFREYVPDSGWPLTYSDLLPWYRRACQTLEIGPFEWNAVSRAQAMAKPLLPLGPAIDHRYYQFSPPTRFARTYGGALEQAEDIRLITHVNVTDIRLGQERGRVDSFSCRTLGGKTLHVHADRYVLALGGIENARVLLASRSQQPEGVANGNDVVGRYFMEHPHYYGSIGLVHAATVDLSFYRRITSDLKRANGTAVPLRGALGLAADVTQSEKLLNFSATFQAVSAKAETGDLPASTTQALLRSKGGFQAAEMSVRAEQSPLADSRITLTDELDPLGVPRIALHWRIAPEDDEKMRRALVILARELAAAGIARARVPGDASRFIWRQSPGGHHMGTTRMGTDPRLSVVDNGCRAHEVDNLYIAGSSVFPTVGDANPTLTIVALAHRLADSLKPPAARSPQASGPGVSEPATESRTA
jgi:choline dehydrogenase-like flavoprotein